MHSRFITIASHLALGILCMSLASAQENQDKHVMLDKLEGSWILDSMEIKGENVKEKNCCSIPGNEADDQGRQDGRLSRGWYAIRMSNCHTW